MALIRVFISYAQSDSSVVDRLAADLEARNVAECRVDRKGIAGGASIQDSIARAIRECDAFLVVCSPESLIKSKWVPGEIKYASDHEKRIIPLLYLDVDLPPLLTDKLAFSIAGAHYSDGLEQLIAELTVLPPRPEPSKFAPPPPGLMGGGIDPVQPPELKSRERDPEADELYTFGIDMLQENPEAAVVAWQRVLERQPEYLNGSLRTRLDRLLEEVVLPARRQNLRNQARQAMADKEWRSATGAWASLLAASPHDADAKQQLETTLYARAREDHETGAWGDEIGAWVELQNRKPGDDYISERSERQTKCAI